jgi:1-acyl-sn-glycerol-3-phosphate acyltransferase
MVEPASRLKALCIRLHACVVIVWLVASTCIYGSGAILFSHVNARASYFFVRLWASHLLLFAGISVRVNGLRKLKTGTRYIFVSNHASVFDIPALFSVLPLPIAFIAKRELFSIPFFGAILRAIGCVPVDRSNARRAREVMDAAVSQLGKTRRSLALFPEGTRSETGKIGPFKSASFALAQETGNPIVPVYIGGSYAILQKKSLLVRPGAVTCTIGDPIDLHISGSVKKSELSDMVRDVLVMMEEAASRL